MGLLTLLIRYLDQHGSQEDIVKKEKVGDEAEDDNGRAEHHKDLVQPAGRPGPMVRVGLEQGDVADDPQVGGQLSRGHSQLEPSATKIIMFGFLDFDNLVFLSTCS